MRLAPLCLLLVPWLAGAAPPEPQAFPYASTHFTGEERQEKLGKTSQGEFAKNAAQGSLPQLVRTGTLPSGLTDEEQALLREVEALSQERPSGRWYEASFRERFTPPEELFVPSYVTDLVVLPRAHLSPAQEPGRKFPNLRVLEGSPQKKGKAYFVWRLHSSEDGPWGGRDTMVHVLALFERGRLTRWVEWRRMEGIEKFYRLGLAPTFSASVFVPTWREGKVWRLERRWLEILDGCLVPDEGGLTLRTTTFEAQEP